MILGTGVFVVIPGGTLVAFVYPYFVSGYAMNEFKLLENVVYKKLIQPLCGIIWIILLIFYKKVHYIYISGLTWKVKELGLFGQITVDMYRYIIGLVGCIAVIGFMKWLYGILSQKEISFDIIERFGRHTLEIYILQRIVLEGFFAKAYGHVVNYMGQNILAQNQLMFDVCFTLVCALIIGILVLKISEIISKHSYLSVCLFGRGKSLCVRIVVSER